jgi:hypothetical protein
MVEREDAGVTSSVSPFHAVDFGGMAGNITQAAVKGMSARERVPHRPHPAPTPRAKNAETAHTTPHRRQGVSPRGSADSRAETDSREATGPGE